MYDSLWSANFSCCYKSEVVKFSDFEVKVKETHKILLFWLVAKLRLPLRGNAIVAQKIEIFISTDWKSPKKPERMFFK